MAQRCCSFTIKAPTMRFAAAQLQHQRAIIAVKPAIRMICSVGGPAVARVAGDGGCTGGRGLALALKVLEGPEQP
jgi:hypothetical protein